MTDHSTARALHGDLARAGGAHSMTDRARELVKLPSKALFCHGTIPEPLSAECRQWLVDQLHSYPKRVNEDRTCAIGALTEMATTEFCRLMAEQSLTPPEGDTVSDEAVARQFERLKAVEDVLANGAARADDPECHPLYPQAVAARQILERAIAALQSRVSPQADDLMTEHRKTLQIVEFRLALSRITEHYSPDTVAGRLAADVLAKYPRPYENADRENDDEPFEVEEIKGLPLSAIDSENERLRERFYIDCEFDGHGGPLLSIALVHEGGCSIHVQTDQEPSDPWVQANVMPIMGGHNAATECIGLPINRVGAVLRDWLGDAENPVFIADSPVDIGRICEALSTGEDGGWQSTGYRKMSFEVWNVDCYPTDLEGAVQHNAWWDAMALRHKLAALSSPPAEGANHAE